MSKRTKLRVIKKTEGYEVGQIIEADPVDTEILCALGVVERAKVAKKGKPKVETRALAPEPAPEPASEPRVAEGSEGTGPVVDAKEEPRKKPKVGTYARRDMAPEKPKATP